MKKGKVTIDAPPSVPIPDSGNDTGSGSGQAGAGSNQTNNADGSANAAGASAGDTSGATIGNSGPIGSNSLPPNNTNAVYPPASLFISDSRSSFSNQDDFVKNSLEETPSKDDLDSPEAVRRRMLTFLEARQLAGEKWTAQAIAQKLDIPLEIAQIAVLNPIGQNIKVPIPDISELYNGTLVAGDSAGTGIFCDDGICKLLIGGIVMAVSLSVNVLSDLWNNIFQSKSKDVPKDNEDDQNQDNGKDQSKDSEKSEKIDPGKTIEKQLQGKGQLKDLRSGRNWDEKISINDALRKTYSELQDMVKNGELSKSGLRRIEKAFEGRDLGKRGKNK